MESKTTYHQQRSFCGKARCGKCRSGIGHGPYWYSYKTVNGRVKRTYIGKELPAGAMQLGVIEQSTASSLDTLTTSTPSTTVESPTVGRIHRNPLVGREKERTLLHALLLQVEQYSTSSISANSLAQLPLDTQRTAQCVVLLGEAGIGKTRLAEELGREALQRGWTILWSRAYAQESGIPYRMWTDILRKAFGTDGSISPAEREILARPLQVLLPDLWTAQPMNETLASVEPEQEQLRLREAASSLLTTVSQTRPLLIVLDDVQWADGSSVELLGYLARHLYNVPILLLATCRSNEASQSLNTMVNHMQREHTIAVMPIEPLTSGEIAQLIEHVPMQQAQQIQIQAAGNPFFAEELARSANPPSLPNSISAALDSRMNSLSSECRALLRNAAVLGSSFEFPLIHALEVKRIGEQADEDVLFDLLEEAIEAGVLTEEGTAAHVAYVFWHPLMVTHLYDSISAMRRTSMHRRIADILLRMYRGREAEFAATIAHHLLNGGAEPLQVAHYAELAGDRAYALLAYSEAERYYRIALDALNSNAIPAEHDGPTSLLAPMHRGLLTERLAECVMVQGNFAEARVLFEHVLELRTKETDNPPSAEEEVQVQALLWSEIGRTWLYVGDRTKARLYYERGEGLLRNAHVQSGFAHARLRVLQGGLFAQEGEYADALSAANDALSLFQDATAHQQASPESASFMPASRIQRTLRGDANDLGRIYMLLGGVLHSTGQLNDALARLQTALRMFEQRDQKREIANALCNIGYILLKKSELVQAQEAFERSLAIVKYIGDGPITSVVFSNMGELAFWRDNLAEAENWYKRSLELAEQFKDRIYINKWNARLAVILQMQGKDAEAGACVVSAFKVGRAMKNTLCIGHALLALANVRMVQARQRGEQRLLHHAYAAATRALLLPKLDAETTMQGQLLLASTLLQLHPTSEARTRLEGVVQQAHAYNLVLIEQQGRKLLDESHKR